MTTFDVISEVCLTWPHRAIPDTENSSTLHTRIAQILRELKDAPNALSTGTGNLVAMLRQLLRETSVKRDRPDLPTGGTECRHSRMAITGGMGGIQHDRQQSGRPVPRYRTRIGSITRKPN